MSRVRLSLSHRVYEDSPSCLLRLLLALSSNWRSLFIGRVVFVFHSLESFCFCCCFGLCYFVSRHAAICCLTGVSTLTPMAQMKPSSSRPTAVMILRWSLPATTNFM